MQESSRRHEEHLTQIRWPSEERSKLPAMLTEIGTDVAEPAFFGGDQRDGEEDPRAAWAFRKKKNCSTQ